MDLQHNTTLSALEDARSRYKPIIFIDSGVLVDFFRKYSGGRTRLLRREMGRSGEKRVTAVGTTHNSSTDQQHRTAFYALKDARSSYKPAIFMDSGFLVDTSSDVLGGKGLDPCGGRWLGQG